MNLSRNPQGNPIPTLRYRPEIDGLRAIAVIPVIIFHMNPEVIPGGFIGVDIFFVISGYLITSIIIKEKQTSNFSIINFWSRRIRRILPGLLAMTGTTLIAGFFLLYKTAHQELGSQGLSTIFSLANLHMWFLTRDYWGPQADDSFFLHTWSLSIEEQFYTVLPLLLLFFFKYRPQLLPRCSLAFTILCYAIFAYTAPDRPNAVFYLLPFRAWELALGCSLAFYQGKISKTSNLFALSTSFLGWLGLILILSSFFTISGREGISWTLIFPTLGTACVIAFVFRKEQKSHSLLSSSILVFIGKISYSLYIWHWPILVFTKYQSNQPSDLVKLTVIFLIALASYQFVEKPCRNRTGIIPYIGIAFLACLVCASYLSYFDSRYDVTKFEKVVWAGARYDSTPSPKEWNEFTKKRFEGIEIIPRPSNAINDLDQGGITLNYGGVSSDLLLIGDSHSLMWAPIIDEVAQDMSLTVSFYGRDHQSPFLYPPGKMDDGTLHAQYNRQVINALEKGVKLVILAVRWSFWHQSDAGMTIKQIIQTGSSVLLIEQPPELFFGNKNTPQYLSFMGIEPTIGKNKYIKTGNRKNYEKGLAKIRDLAAKYDRCRALELKDLYLNKHGMVKVLSGKQVLYVDDDHLSLQGAHVAKERLEAGILMSIATVNDSEN